MTIHYVHILALPVLLLIWSIDLWLLLASVRLILGWIPAAGRACQALSRLTDPVPQVVHGWLSRRGHKPVPTWLLWLIVLLAALVVRHLLVWSVISTI